MKPSFATRASSERTPTRIAVIAANEAYRTGSPPASGATAAAVMIALVASGPMITCLEVPNSAYITIAARATYSPATGVTPARSP